jgi:oligopeptide/dipeptide ABC transporter ATP-binding protein
MYAGNLVEYGDVETIFKEPKHPYTKALLACIPVMGMERGSLSAIDGNVPNALNYPSGCRFHTRCQNVTPLCKKQAPQLIGIDDGAKVACHNY